MDNNYQIVLTEQERNALLEFLRGNKPNRAVLDTVRHKVETDHIILDE